MQLVLFLPQYPTSTVLALNDHPLYLGLDELPFLWAYCAVIVVVEDWPNLIRETPLPDHGRGYVRGIADVARSAARDVLYAIDYRVVRYQRPRSVRHDECTH